MTGTLGLQAASTSQTRSLDPYLDRLRAVDWNFAGQRERSPVDCLHPYPAKFIPELPGALLDNLPLPKGAVILDPFAGSGTTLAEAQKRGFQSVGIDLNPIACLIARVRTAPLPHAPLDSANQAVERALAVKSLEVPTIPNLDHWFNKSAQDVVARLVLAIATTSEEYHDFLRLALSSILVRVSNQDSDTRYAAVANNINAAGVYKAFVGACERIENALGGRSCSLTNAHVIEGDTLKVEPEDIGRSIDAVITSPPYPNAYEYWLYHKYRMWWLGYDPLAVKEREIGARAHFFGGKKHTASDFVGQMSQTFELIDDVLKPEGFASFVVGRSKIHGEIVDNAEIIRNAGRDFGFRQVFTTERVISSSRKSFNLAHANIKTETVLVLAR